MAPATDDAALQGDAAGDAGDPHPERYACKPHGEAGTCKHADQT